MNDSVSGGLGRFLTVADAAEVLNVTVTEVQELISSGELPAIRVGTHGPWRVERDVLESYIDALYEMNRREKLWRQADFAGLPEIAEGRIVPHD